MANRTQQESEALEGTVGKREQFVKMHLVGVGKAGTSDVQPSNVVATAEDSQASQLFARAGAVDPPYNPVTLANLLEMSNALRQNVDAYATNVDGFGHRFEPVIDLDAADSDQRIAQAIYIDRTRQRSDPQQPASVVSQPLTPTVEEISAKKKELVELMRAEKTRLEFFFDFCSDEESFVSLRRKLRQDLEVTGNAYMEVLRNGAGEIAQFTYVPSFTVRLMPLDKAPVDVEVPVRVSDIAFDCVTKKKRFRKMVQVFENRVVFFKEFGDRRVISMKTGATYDSTKAMLAADETDTPATECIHFKVHSSRSSYGIPRWIGTLVSVLGSRQAEEVNLLYFENKSIPPMAILVSGGRLTEETVKRLESYIESEIKGKKNFHKMMILEAEGQSGNTLAGGDASGVMKIELKPLTDAQTKDALFQNYDERNIDKIGMAFRLPRLLRGDIRDFNRASAEAALDFAEQQVFSPERTEFDFIINRKVLADLGIKFWKFQSNAVTVKDPAVLAGIINQLVLCNVLTPEEAREFAGDVFNKELATINASWVKQPVPLTLAGMVPEGDELSPFTGQTPRVGEQDAAFDDRDADGKPDGPQLKLTPTAMSMVTTVNEARRAHGFGPKTLPDGTPDPHGDLTIAEYQAQRGAGPSAQQAPPKGRPAASVTMSSGDLSVADLQNVGGLLGLHQGRSFRRARPGKQAAPASTVDAAKQLIALRDAFLDQEVSEAAQRFLAAKREELATSIARIPDAVLRENFPLETISDEGVE